MDAKQWKTMYGGARQLTLARPANTARLEGATRPTREALLKHAAKYGWEGVEETAASYGIALSEPVAERRARASAKRRAKGPTLKQRVAALIARGVDVDGIAEAENLSPSRARRVMAEASEPTPKRVRRTRRATGGQAAS